MRNPKDVEVVIGGETKNLEEVIQAHEDFLAGLPQGIKASLSGQDLQHVILTNRDLRDIDFTNANLFNADVMNADFRGADLTGANIDFAQLNISCKSLSFKIGDKNAKMLLYMILTIMQYSDIDISSLVTQEMITYLEDSHLVTEHELEKLKLINEN